MCARHRFEEHLRADQGVLTLILGILCTAFAAQANAQTSVPPRGPVYNWNVYAGPATALSAQIHAEADFVRAYGEASLNLAYAREARAHAIRQEIANSVEYVRAYYEGKSIYEAEKLKRYVAPLKRAKIQNSKTWERLKDHPELNGPAIMNGTAQNFLLNRLSGSVLAYRFSVGQDKYDPELLTQLDLSPEFVHQLWFVQDAGNNQRYRFRADEGTALKVDWWPFVVRGDEFAGFRKDFEKARRQIAGEAKQDGAITNKSLKELMQVLDALDAEVHKQYQGELRKNRQGVSTHGSFAHYFLAKRFIQSLAGEVSNLQRTGDPKALDGGLKFEGKNLVELLTYMSRNGLQFAAAQPGKEAAYHNLFRMMRDLYVTIADDDSSLAK